MATTGSTMPARHPTMSRLPILLSVLAACLPAPASAQSPDPDALPNGARVVAGQARISSQERSLSVHQQSARAIVEWQQFDIGSDASVEFIQPSSNAVALNRVAGGNASRIAGQLKANGRVYLVNAAGIVFGAGARVDVGQLVTSTMDIADGDFLTGGDRLVGALDRGPGLSISSGPGSARAQLPLPPATPDEADLADGAQRPDTGSAPARAAQLTLDAGADGHLRLGVPHSQIQALLAEGGLVEDEDGLTLTAQGADSLAAAVVGRDPRAGAVRLSRMEDGRLWLRAADEARTRAD
jgi:filamentous hemagglutinin family protein